MTDAKRQSSVRLPARIWKQVEELKQQYGTQTTVLEIAIDRLYREEHMQSKNVTDITVDTANLAIVANMRSQDLDELENVIHVRRLQLMAARLEANGFAVMVQHHNVFFDMLLVGVPGVTAPAEWATLSECRRLLDTVHNLPPAEAFARWREKIQPVAEEPYTEAQARADVRREREELRHRYEAGEIDSGMYADLYKAARTYLDLAKK